MYNEMKYRKRGKFHWAKLSRFSRFLRRPRKFSREYFAQSKMALLKYLRLKSGSSTSKNLPDENGPLCKEVPASSIREANMEVMEVMRSSAGKRASYLKIAAEKKAVIAKYAAENGIVAALGHFAKDYPDGSLKESTVRGWKKEYLNELARRKRNGEELSVKSLPSAKTGRPLTLGSTLDNQVQAYLIATREAGGVVNSEVAIAAAVGIVRKKDSNLLAQNGGHIVLTRDWARSLLGRMGFVKRKANTKAKLAVTDFNELKSQFINDVRTFKDLEEVPDCLILNWDQTAIKYVPVAEWTMEKQGSKKVKIAGLDDKRQITAVFAATMSGGFLAPQLIYKGTTQACVPTVSFPDSWHITFTHNHWCNEPP